MGQIRASSRPVPAQPLKRQDSAPMSISARVAPSEPLAYAGHRIDPERRRGRGATINPGGRFEAEQRIDEDDGWGSLGELPAFKTEVAVEKPRTIITRNDSPDISFDRSINPYRGCEHGCVYCFARPSHAYLGLSPGLDFESKLTAKPDAALLLEKELSAASYQPRTIAIGTNTDAYQPIERKLGITRSIIELLHECRHPFSMVTKSSGIERDLDLVAPMAAQRLAAIYVSITSLDPKLARILEPRAAAPHRRLRTVETLAKAGVPVGVSVSPVIPFINEPELERILEAAAEAGAQSAFSIVLRLPWEVNPLFQQWLDQHFPERAARVMARIREMRGGKDYDASFGQRMRGTGVWAQLLRQRFDKACARLGLNKTRIELDTTLFRKPMIEPAAALRRAPDTASGQGELF
jgi:DNA repair photolyase